MVRTRTKKLRGGHYGRGMKAGRGKGKKGGSGNAGVGKHMWIWYVKNDPLHFGGKGFHSHHVKRERSITLRELGSSIDMLKEKGFVSGDDVLKIDLKGAGYTKLLGSGNLGIKSNIVVPRATEKAIRKLSVSGSTVEVDG